MLSPAAGVAQDQETQYENNEKDNKTEQTEKPDIDNQPLTNNIGSQLSPENPPLPEPYYSTENKRQQNTRPDDAIDGVKLTPPPAVNIISRDDLHELLHPTRKAYKANAKSGTTNLIFAAEKQNHAL